MNRSIAGIGIAVILVGLGLVSFPIVVLGQERLDPEQIVGFLVTPIGLFVVLIAAIAVDPRRTTVPGAFGNPEESTRGLTAEPLPRPRAPLGTSVYCRYCRAVIVVELSRCPRCSRARECRPCGRPLGTVLDRPTCPTCARPEATCHCPFLSRPAPAREARPARGPGR
jgi:hypothetical protein